MIPSKLYASTPSDEEKVIVVGDKYFETLIPYLDLKRNRKAYVMVPEKDRYTLNNIQRILGKEAETTSPSLLRVDVHPSLSSWDKEGNYTSPYFNLITPTSKKSQYNSIEEEIDAEEGEGGYVAETSYVTMMKSYNSRFDLPQGYLKTSDGAKLLHQESFWDNKERPFAYKVSAVYAKDSQAYILVLDSLLDKYISLKEKPIVPVLQISLIEGRKDEMSDIALFVYEVMYGKGSWDQLKSYLTESYAEIRKLFPSAVRGDREFVVYKDPISLSNRITVYSSIPNPTSYEDLSLERDKYKFSVGYYNHLPIITEFVDGIDIFDMLERAKTDMEIYRVFSHNCYDKKPGKYVKADSITLFIKDFYKFHDGKSFPIREIPRRVQWEPREAPYIPEKYLNMDGNAVDIAIQYYLETGIGVSYWNFRETTKN